MRKKLYVRFALTLIILLAFTGCGNKGSVTSDISANSIITPLETTQSNPETVVSASVQDTTVSALPPDTESSVLTPDSKVSESANETGISASDAGNSEVTPGDSGDAATTKEDTNTQTSAPGSESEPQPEASEQESTSNPESESFSEPEPELKPEVETVTAALSTAENWNLLSGEPVPVSNDFYYCLYNEKKAKITFYDSNRELISTDILNGNSKGNYLLFDCSYVQISVSGTAYFVSTGIKSDGTIESDCSFYVVGKNSPVKLSVASAVKKVASKGLVLILPGTYTEKVEGWKKTVNILGVNKETTIIENSTGNYKTPPVEIGAGSLSGLTIRALGEATDGLGCYAVHVEDDNLTGKTLTISNCTLSSESAPGLGMGLRKGSVTIENCVIDKIFAHDSDIEKKGGLQKLIIRNSTIDSLLFTSLNKPSSDIRITLSGNTILSTEIIGENITVKNDLDD